MNYEIALNQSHQFTSLAAATSFAQRGVKTLYVLHGDTGTYLVCVGKVAAWLEKNGYEIVY